MGMYRCNGVSEILQQTKGVLVVDKTVDAWRFKYRDAYLYLRVLPGCCGVLLLYQLRGKDSELLRLIKITAQAARRSGFGMVAMSLLNTSPLRKRLGAEWAASTFKNPRTGNSVDVLTYALPVKEKRKAPQRVHEDV